MGRPSIGWGGPPMHNVRGDPWMVHFAEGISPPTNIQGQTRKGIRPSVTAAGGDRDLKYRHNSPAVGARRCGEDSTNFSERRSVPGSRLQTGGNPHGRSRRERDWKDVPVAFPTRDCTKCRKFFKTGPAKSGFLDQCFKHISHLNEITYDIHKVPLEGWKQCPQLGRSTYQAVSEGH